jgi:hypothetical protein
MSVFVGARLLVNRTLNALTAPNLISLARWRD